jgi:hypothetical protein
MAKGAKNQAKNTFPNPWIQTEREEHTLTSEAKQIYQVNVAEMGRRAVQRWTVRAMKEVLKRERSTATGPDLEKR